MDKLVVTHDYGPCTYDVIIYDVSIETTAFNQPNMEVMEVLDDILTSSVEGGGGLKTPLIPEAPPLPSGPVVRQAPPAPGVPIERQAAPPPPPAPPAPPIRQAPAVPVIRRAPPPPPVSSVRPAVSASTMPQVGLAPPV